MAMGSQKASRVSSSASLSTKTKNKLHRQDLYIQQKKSAGKQRRDERLRRRKEEDKDPELRQQRLAKNKPKTIDSKRVWDDVDDDSLGAVVDVAQLVRRRQEQEADEALQQAEVDKVDEDEVLHDDIDSMLDSDEEDEDAAERTERIRASRAERRPSLAPSTASTNLDLTPAALAAKFPNLFSDEPPPPPKILVTTSLNSTLHYEAQLLCNLFPNTQYIRRTSHRYGRKYSLREIAKYASNRGFTTILLLREDQKKPTALSVACLPQGPTFYFTISKFIEGKKLPGHGNPTNHYPELLLNNFKTPLGLLTAKLFQTLFPPQPEVQGRQVVTIHNSRDYLLLRRHRYVFREKRQTEKSVVDAEGREIPGGIKAGLQELGPAINMKLRRVDKGIGRAGSEGEDAVQWEWKSKMEKTRTRFNI